MPGGRPTDYTPELADKICAWIAEGNSARSACREFGFGMSTLFRWLRERSDFREQYVRAREESADTLVDDMREIEASEPDVQRAKLKCDNRKWVAARMSPRKWGDRQQVEHTGPGVVSGDAMKPEDWASQYADKADESQSKATH